MYTLARENSFKKDYKRCLKRGYDIDLFWQIVSYLTKHGKLSAIYKPHKLKGDYKGHWECHLKPNWLLVWLQDDKEKIITLTRTGTHSDLFQ